MKNLLVTLLTLFLVAQVVIAQEKKDEKGKTEKNTKWEIGINAGVEKFTGEFNMSSDAFLHHFNHWKGDMDFGVGALVRKNFGNVFALEAMWNYTNLTGRWNWSSANIPDFKTEVNEYTVNSVWNMNNLLSKNKFDRKVFWYTKLGVGAVHLWRKTGETSMYGHHLKFIDIPVGTGLSFKVSDNFRFEVGTQYSVANTDRFDSRRTVPTTPNNKMEVYGTKLYTHVGLTYAFGKKKKQEPMVVEQPKPEPKPEPKPQPKPEPKPEPKVKPAVIGNVYKVYFGFDKWDLTSQAKADLDKLANDMLSNPSVNVDIKSHTDSRGPASYNMKLSEKRGKSVIDYLVGKGINASRINAQAFGETQPVNKCKDGVPCTKAEYALNRRTETIVIE